MTEQQSPLLELGADSSQVFQMLLFLLLEERITYISLELILLQIMCYFMNLCCFCSSYEIHLLGFCSVSVQR